MSWARSGVDDVVDLEKLALLHEKPDHVGAAFRHAVGELLHGDRLGDDDLADDLLARALIERADALALAAPADGGERALALGVVERVDQRQLAATAIVGGALDRLGLGRPRRLHAPAQAAGALLFLGLDVLEQFQRRPRDRRRLELAVGGDRGGSLALLLAAEAAAGGILGALACRFLGLAPRLFLVLAALGVLTLARHAGVLLGAALCRLLGGAALLGLVHLGVGERAGARVELVGGELAENQSGARRGVRLLGRRRPCRRRFDARGRPCHRRGAGSHRLRPRLLAGREHPALLALDLNRIRAAMREALPNDVAFDIASLEAQRLLGRYRDRLVAGVLRFRHALFSPGDKSLSSRTRH